MHGNRLPAVCQRERPAVTDCYNKAVGTCTYKNLRSTSLKNTEEARLECLQRRPSAPCSPSDTATGG